MTASNAPGGRAGAAAQAVSHRLLAVGRTGDARARTLAGVQAFLGLLARSPHRSAVLAATALVALASCAVWASWPTVAAAAARPAAVAVTAAGLVSQAIAMATLSRAGRAYDARDGHPGAFARLLGCAWIAQMAAAGCGSAAAALWAGLAVFAYRGPDDLALALWVPCAALAAFALLAAVSRLPSRGMAAADWIARPAPPASSWAEQAWMAFNPLRRHELALTTPRAPGDVAVLYGLSQPVDAQAAVRWPYWDLRQSVLLRRELSLRALGAGRILILSMPLALLAYLVGPSHWHRPFLAAPPADFEGSRASDPGGAPSPQAGETEPEPNGGQKPAEPAPSEAGEMGRTLGHADATSNGAASDDRHPAEPGTDGRVPPADAANARANGAGGNGAGRDDAGGRGAGDDGAGSDGAGGRGAGGDGAGGDSARSKVGSHGSGSASPGAGVFGAVGANGEDGRSDAAGQGTGRPEGAGEAAGADNSGTSAGGTGAGGTGAGAPGNAGRAVPPTGGPEGASGKGGNQGSAAADAGDPGSAAAGAGSPGTGDAGVGIGTDAAAAERATGADAPGSGTDGHGSAARASGAGEPGPQDAGGAASTAAGPGGSANTGTGAGTGTAGQRSADASAGGADANRANAAAPGGPGTGGTGAEETAAGAAEPEAGPASGNAAPGHSFGGPQPSPSGLDADPTGTAGAAAGHSPTGPNDAAAETVVEVQAVRVRLVDELPEGGEAVEVLVARREGEQVPAEVAALPVVAGPTSVEIPKEGGILIDLPPLPGGLPGAPPTVAATDVPTAAPAAAVPAPPAENRPRQPLPAWVARLMSPPSVPTASGAPDAP